MMRIAVTAAFAALASTPTFAQQSDPGRFPQLAPETMTDAQKEAATGLPMLSGPFNVALRSPELTKQIQAMSQYLRARTTLPPRLAELAILITARHWSAQYEWWGHYPMAMKAGVSPATAADIAAGKRPTQMQPDEEAVYDFLTALQDRHAVDDAVFTRAKAALGERQLVDLIGLVGLYDTVSMMLDVGKVGVPPGATPLPPLAETAPLR